MSGGVQPGGIGPRTDESRGRRPYWLVGVVLLGVMVVVLGGALVLDRALRSQVSIEPIAGSGTQAESAETRAGATTLAVGTATTGPSARATDTSTGQQTPEQAVEQAYLRYWDVYSAALLNLDDSRLGEVSTGDELRRIGNEIAGYRRAGYAVRVRVTHNYVIVDVTANEARLADEILDRSFRVDPVTKDPPQGSDEGATIRDLFVLQRIDGVWKVVTSVRESG